MGRLTEYAKEGYYVFPLVKGMKVPAMELGKKHEHASNDLAQAEQWERQYKDCNVGLPCGPKNGFWILDLDLYNLLNADSRKDQLERISALLGGIEVPTVKTPRGGLHLFFKWDKRAEELGFSAQAGLEGFMDIRGYGGYAVGAGSETPDGVYTWMNGTREPAQATDDLYYMLEQAMNVKKKSDQGVTFTGDGKVTSGRWSYLRKTANSLKYRYGFSAGLIAEILKQTQAEKCVFEKDEKPYPDEELERLANDACSFISTNVIGDPANFPKTDLEHRDAWIQQYGENFLYTELGWYAWDQKRFVKDAGNKLLVESLDAYMQWLKSQASLLDTKDVYKAVESVQSKSRYLGIPVMAEASRWVSADVLDSAKHKHLLNVQNGVVDLTTGDLLPHDRRYLFSNITDAEYHMNAKCPQFEKFLHRIFDPDSKSGKTRTKKQREDLIDYLQRAVGYTASGDIESHKIFFLYGTGRNGKSTLTTVLSEVLGSYAETIQTSVLTSMASKSNGPTPSIIGLKGKRLATANELSRDALLDEALIKNITGGEKWSGRDLYSKQVSFRPQFTLWFSSNSKPNIYDNSAGFWSRMVLIPFDAYIAESERDTNIVSKLLSERNGILRWIVEGYAKYLKRGLTPPDEVRKEIEDYRVESNKLSPYVEHCIAEMKGGYVSLSDLYAKYLDWHSKYDKGSKPYGNLKFSREMESLGYKKGKATSGQHKDLTIFRDIVIKYF